MYYAKLWKSGYGTTSANNGNNIVDVRGYETREARDKACEEYEAPNHTPSARLEAAKASDADVRHAIKEDQVLVWDEDYAEWMPA